jgi:hypothetical protein
VWSEISASGELGLLPPPLGGEDWGGGERAHMNVFASALDLVACPSLSLPRKRGRERTEQAALNCFKYKTSTL